MRRIRGLAVAAGGVLLLAAGVAPAQGLGLGLVGGKCCCPPPLKWCSEQAPKICYKCACPRPVCDPCSLQHYGYYQTCWQPWPFPPDWSHCPTPPPGAVLPPPAYPPYTPKGPQEQRREERRDNDLAPPRRDGPEVEKLSYSAATPASALPALAPVPAAPAERPAEGVRLVR